jgi:hypothetical protein
MIGAFRRERADAAIFRGSADPCCAFVQLRRGGAPCNTYAGPHDALWNSQPFYDRAQTRNGNSVQTRQRFTQSWGLGYLEPDTGVNATHLKFPYRSCYQQKGCARVGPTGLLRRLRGAKTLNSLRCTSLDLHGAEDLGSATASAAIWGTTDVLRASCHACPLTRFGSRSLDYSTSRADPDAGQRTSTNLLPFVELPLL